MSVLRLLFVGDYHQFFLTLMIGEDQSDEIGIRRVRVCLEAKFLGLFVSREK